MSNASYETLAGRYELHRQLASGGSADVFLARDQLLNRPVAVKVLNASLAEDEAFVERLRREAQVVASLNHQNIVGVFDQGEHEGAPFIVMEYVESRSLAEILRSEGRLHPDRAATIAVDVAAALDAAHRQGMVHMDVKPGNVLITADGQVKLADFGIAKAMIEGHQTDLTSEGGTVMGTATYLSPEQAQGHKVGPRSDVYSLSVVLYEMMTGRPPFIGDSPIDIARQHVEQPPQPPSRLGVDIAQSLEAITLKGLAKSPVNRYPTVRDFAADLKRYLGGAHSLQGPGAKQSSDVGQKRPPRPATGRSTPPDIEDATVILPVARPSVGSTHAVQVAPTPQHVVAQRVDPLPARPVVGQRSDDTWKRNVLFFLALLVLLVLLAFLAQAFIDVLRTDERDVNETDTTIVDATVEVRNYLNFGSDQARSLIESDNLVPDVQFKPNSDVEQGVVFDQSPPPGRIVEEGSRVTIIVSQADGQVEVPSVVTQDLDDAIRALSQLGLIPQVREEDSDIFGPDEVIGQSPLPGELVDRGSPVEITVSLGPSERTVPDLAGESLTTALNQIIELDFRTALIQEANAEVEEGNILRTEPAAGSLLRGGELVTLYVSSGVARVLVPNLSGLLADSARQQLISQGFEVQTEFFEVDDPADVNKVIDQSPPPNIELTEGSTVTIVVGQEAPPEETTTTVPPTTTTTTTTGG